MENDMTTMAADLAMANPMTSCKDVTRTCPLLPPSVTPLSLPIPRKQEVIQFEWGVNGYVARKSTGISLSKSDKASEMNLEKYEIVKSSVVKRKDTFSAIKRDDIFEHYINGAEDRISKGYGSDTALNYYKLYFEKEQ